MYACSWLSHTFINECTSRLQVNTIRFGNARRRKLTCGDKTKTFFFLEISIYRMIFESQNLSRHPFTTLLNYHCKLRGTAPKPKLSMFLRYLNIFNTILKKKNSKSTLKHIVWETQLWHHNLWHVLLNNFRTLWLTKIVMPFIWVSQTICLKISIYFFKRCWKTCSILSLGCSSPLISSYLWGVVDK